MKITPTAIAGVLLIEPAVFADDRGFFLETWHAERYAAAGLPPFVQANHAHSRGGVLRGLHYQITHPQGKLVWAVAGEIFDVAVDIRRGSPTFGRWVAATLSGENHRQLFVPAGLAHGYYVTSERADVSYLCTDFYRPDGDRGVRWDDPSLAVDWPPGERLLSAKDRALPLLADVPELSAHPEPAAGANPTPSGGPR